MSNNANPNNNRPRGREQHVTGKGKDIYKRGDGLGSGPVGSADGHAGRQDAVSGGSGGQQRPQSQRQTRGGISPLLIIIVLAVVLLGGGGGLSGLFGNLLGGDTGSGSTGGVADLLGGTTTQQSVTQQNSVTQQSPSLSSLAGGLDLSSLLGFTSGGSASTASVNGVSNGWSSSSNVRKLDTSVASGARAKRTQILGNGRDTVTLMVYMCGTDLESKSGMATADLNEMLSATLSDQINIIVYTGGCKQWRNNTISSSVNQVYKVESGGLRLLVDNAGAPAMTDPATLADFIQFCAKNYPANRNELIFWDHGGGSLSGYGYDEKNARSGSMSLSGIDQALKAGGVTFDFIGFDACLMATLENAVMLSDYADYLIASEETEPGVGWYYTNWLTKWSQNTSMSTLEVGKNICDDFVSVCNQKCPGQDTTLSVVDLAELEKTVPDKLKAFASGTTQMLQNGEYQTVSKARSGAREFATSSRIDQIDLVHLAQNLNTAESNALAQTLLGAVKYNNTSSSITNAYGLSAYFPYRSSSKVDSAVSTYSAIGMDDEYAKAIQQFASLEVGGQAVSGGASSPLDSLLGAYGGSGAMDTDMIAELLGSLLGGRSLGNVEGLDRDNTGFLSALDADSAAEYLSRNQFDPEQLVWTGDGPAITLSEDQWKLVNDMELSVFYDDGEGYIDLGLDNVYDFTEDGGLLGQFSGTWLAIDQQPVPYYHVSSVYEDDRYTITGRVPVLLNGERAELMLVFNDENPYGIIAGARLEYHDGETETIPKSFTELEEGDEIDFVCDYYGYDGSYQDSYLLGDAWTYHAEYEISDVEIDAAKAQALYRFTDIYDQHYWTPAIP